jgi:hypothetical protein
MRRSTGAAGLVVAILSAVGVAMLAAGCGAAPASDPFTGSWSMSGQSPPAAVISRSPDGYRAAFVVYGRTLSTLSFKRHGDRLEATIKVKGASPYSWSIVVERRAGSDRLFWTESGTTVQLSRVSDSTAFPSASPIGQ